MEKGKFVSVYTEKHFNNVTRYATYEYKGKQYQIAMPVGRSIAMGEELSTQHRKEQKRIDEILEMDSKAKSVKYENTAEYALNNFLKEE